MLFVESLSSTADHSFGWSVPRVLLTHKSLSFVQRQLHLPALLYVHLCDACPSDLRALLWYMIVSYNKFLLYTCGRTFDAKSCGWGNFGPSSVLACTLSKTIVPAHGGGPCTPLGLVSHQQLFVLSRLPSLLPNGTSASSGAGSGRGGVCSTLVSSPLLRRPTLCFNTTNQDISLLQPCIVKCSAELSPFQQCLLLSSSLVSFDTSLSGAGLGRSALCSTLALSPTLQHSTSHFDLSRLLFSIWGSIFSFPCIKRCRSFILVSCCNGSSSSSWPFQISSQILAFLLNIGFSRTCCSKFGTFRSAFWSRVDIPSQMLAWETSSVNTGQSCFLSSSFFRSLRLSFQDITSHCKASALHP